MPIRGSKNVRAKYIEFPPELADQIDEFAKSRGESFKDVIVQACIRHLAYPPAMPTVAPLPVEQPSPAKTKRGRPKKSE